MKDYLHKHNGFEKPIKRTMAILAASGALAACGQSTEAIPEPPSTPV